MSALVLCVLASACGRGEIQGSAIPATSPPPASAAAPISASPTASPSPTVYPASAVRIVVNGVERAPGGEILLDGGGPTTVDLLFPFAVDRSSVERLLPSTLSPHWSDDRTLELTVPLSDRSPAFKLLDIRSIDGRRSIALLMVPLAYPPSAVVSVYTVAGVTAAGGPKASATWRVPVPGRQWVSREGFALSPDLSEALEYARPGGVTATPRVSEVASGKTTDLAAPGGDGLFAFGGWLADGRVVLVSRSIWVGAPGSAPLRSVVPGLGEATTEAQPSPRGTYVAVASASGISVVDLRDGAVHPVPGSWGGCHTGLAWSPDESLLAWVDCVASAVRITDVRTGRVVESIAPVARDVAAMPDGDLIVTRDSTQQGEGAQSLGMVYGFNGAEKTHYMGCRWSVSADRRYMLEVACSAVGPPRSNLIDLSAPNGPNVALPGIASWTADGRILVIGGPD